MGGMGRFGHGASLEHAPLSARVYDSRRQPHIGTGERQLRC
jgi:hypothetical protein